MHSSTAEVVSAGPAPSAQHLDASVTRRRPQCLPIMHVDMIRDANDMFSVDDANAAMALKSRAGRAHACMHGFDMDVRKELQRLDSVHHLHGV